MTIKFLLHILGWSALINYSILLFWFLVFTQAHDWVYQIHGRWFAISVEKFDEIHYASMAFYKLAIFLLFLTPYLAIRIVS